MGVVTKLVFGTLLRGGKQVLYHSKYCADGSQSSIPTNTCIN